MRPTILIIEDERDVVDLVQFNLKARGYKVISAETGEKGLQKASSHLPDLIVLDLMLPGLDGLELCRILKRQSKTAHIPVVIATAKATELDRVLGLELGAEDYLVKPFSPRELLLRIERLLKRGTLVAGDEAESFNFGDLSIDIAKHEVIAQGKAVQLTPTEFKLLTLLARRPEKVQTRGKLLQEVWAYGTDAESRTIDTHMRRLRSKLGQAARHLTTVRNFGYLFKA